MIGIIDYNMGNLASVYNACSLLDTKASFVKEPEKLKEFDRIILPGVGAFADAMEHLNKTGMKEAILEYSKSGKPMIGICLGMQLLFDSSEEFGKTQGLGLIKGDIIKFDKSKMKEDFKIPHMGWNTIKNKEHELFDGLEDPYLYFVHSYHAVTKEENIIGKTTYGYEFASAVNKDNIYGFQPHPEKSHDNGLRILQNFMKIK
ncbi:imidazole glycerol phosphate synthase subunit HisH [Malaciobacter molluscorum LMG 25693]|uniref:Imidazole glycerol phosphate synthase subunit HisH n=1 Tax=Malaciobacter molluscorum LMG 25693 TaxID=870501 RepID=A0A2G1DFE8_9BACT|nr:imidazole glycerol phosphate synthase subunit HisH [Malaciobacter molluscorum]AXX91534.1 imidazole glycerol phosphate synthase HisFH, HisH subunit [Malaciobacter molluscorum LMG 25693]PHO17170.1 imidazole glycerol phosphate synthase subunit HisH [Malaciobacter molluscorum LMG 25693]RXJ92770.1 imidazole glycerol phosphate synthase subunit HisH [Malaciobacter molluscorum]